MSMRRKTILLLYLLLYTCTQARPIAVDGRANEVAADDTTTWTGRMQHRLDSLANLPLFETTQLGLYVRDLTTGRDLVRINHRQRMRPASNQKVVTAVAALHCLGAKHCYRTQMWLTGQVCDSVLQGSVCVVGGMDPLLSQGEVMRMAEALHEAGIDSIAGNICLDLTMKNGDDWGWGWCWDDDMTPLRPLMVDKKDRFASELLGSMAHAGIRGDYGGRVTQGECPQEGRLFCEVTHTVEQALQRMMKRSDNYYAESMFYLLGTQGGRRRVGQKECASEVERVIRAVGLNPSDYQVADGSGISLYNYVSPELLVRLLEHAWRTERIRQALYPSLPIAGVDGTLEKRMRRTAAEGNVHAKTGTVAGVSSLSGYATSPEGHILCFSIINQGIPAAQLGRDWQDKVCEVLCSKL